MPRSSDYSFKTGTFPSSWGVAQMSESHLEARKDKKLKKAGSNMSGLEVAAVIVLIVVATTLASFFINSLGDFTITAQPHQQTVSRGENFTVSFDISSKMPVEVVYVNFTTPQGWIQNRGGQYSGSCSTMILNGANITHLYDGNCDITVPSDATFGTNYVIIEVSGPNLRNTKNVIPIEVK